MKFRLIYPAILASAMVVLPSCDDKDTPATPAQEPAPVEQQTPAEPVVEEVLPDSECVAQAIAPALEEFPFVTAGDIAVNTEKNEDGSLSISARVSLQLNDNLLESQVAPAAFNEERKATNEAANKAMQPDSLYLLQIGAPTEMITDEQRAAKPLPENLQAMLNELKELADSQVYIVKIPAGMAFQTTAVMKATKGEDSWVMSDIVLDQAPMGGMSSAIRQSTLPEGAAILTDDFEANRKEEIKQKIAAFNEAAHAYILTREESARAAFTEHTARAEEEARKAEETAAAAAAEKEAWENTCLNFIATGKNFAGEWHRGNRFGEITIHIEKAERFEGSIQFIGSLYDTKLPEASLEIAGRCNLAPAEDGSAHVDITIYDGQYDPDQPTAEVYDAQDGMLSLSLNKEGKLTGIMGCTEWGEKSQKNFSVILAPKAEEPAAKSSKKR